MHVRILSALVCALLMTMPAGAQVNNVKKVFVVVMENHNWSQFKGAANAPYLNNTLLPQASHAEQYYTTILQAFTRACRIIFGWKQARTSASSTTAIQVSIIRARQRTW